MAVHEEKYLESCASYALSALDGNELFDFEAHLKTNCEICRAELRSLEETVALLPSTLSPVHLAPELKERIMFALQLAQVAKADVQEREKEYLDRPPIPTSQPVSQPPQRSWLMVGAAFAAIVILVGLAAYVNTLIEKVNQQYAFILEQETAITKLTTELDRKTAILKILESRRIEIVTMDGLKVNPVGYGKIIWDPEKKVAVLQVSNLPAVPKDKDYQLWMIKDKTPVSAGVFAITSEDAKEAFYKIQELDVSDAKEVNAFAITLEPKGGMPQPTGEMYMLGKTVLN